MLFGRLRVPLADAEPSLARPARERTKSGLHRIDLSRVESPHRPLALLPPPACEDEFAGLDRLDREELDDDDP